MAARIHTLRSVAAAVLAAGSTVDDPSVHIETGIIPPLLSGEMGQSRAGNLLKVLNLIRSTRAASLADGVGEIEELLGEGEVEEVQIDLTGENAVRLMNLHRAKGLEANVFFLADSAPGREHPPTAHVRRGEDGSVGYYLVQAKQGHTPPAGPAARLGGVGGAGAAV